MKHGLLLAALLLALAAAPAWAADPQAVGASCPTNGVTAGPNQSGQTVICTSAAWALAPAFAGNDTATCASTNAGEIKYSSGRAYLCNGSAWTQIEPTPSTSTPTAPSRSGYFVLTKGTYSGNLGGWSGADGTCLTELTTNTGWTGYSTANSNGQLVAAKVHAFLCAGSDCTNLMPLTTYYFANAGNSSAGGASFTTDSNGLGPGDSNNWSGASYFSGTYSYWSNRNYTSTTQWALSQDGWAGSCTGFTSSSSSVNGEYADSANTNNYRWYGVNTYYSACNVSMYLICFVNP